MFSFRGLKELEMYIHVPEFIHRKPKTRSYALTVKCGIGMTAIRAAKCVAHILYTVLCSICVNNYVSFVYFGLNSGHENGRLR